MEYLVHFLLKYCWPSGPFLKKKLCILKKHFYLFGRDKRIRRQKQATRQLINNRIFIGPTHPPPRTRSNVGLGKEISAESLGWLSNIYFYFRRINWYFLMFYDHIASQIDFYSIHVEFVNIWRVYINIHHIYNKFNVKFI